MIDFKKKLEQKTEPVVEFNETTNNQELRKAIGLLECTCRFESLDKHLRQTVKDFIKEMKDKGIKGGF